MRIFRFLVAVLVLAVLTGTLQARPRLTYRRTCGGFLLINVVPYSGAAPIAYQTPAPADSRLDTIIAQNIQIMALLAARNAAPVAPTPAPPIYVPPGAALPPGYTPAPVPPGTVPPGFTPGAPLPQGYVPAPLPQGYTPAPLPQGYSPSPLPQGYAPAPIAGQGGYNPNPIVINVPGGAAPALPQGYTPAPAPAVPAPLPQGYNPNPIGTRAPARMPQRYTRQYPVRTYIIQRR